MDPWCSPTDPTTANCLRRPLKARLLPRRCPRCLLRRRNRRPMPVRLPPLRAESRSPRQVQTATFSTGGVSSLCSVLWSGLMRTDALRECPPEGEDRRIRRPVGLRQGHEGGARLRRGLRRRQAGPACGGGASAATWSVRNLGMGIAGRRATQRRSAVRAKAQACLAGPGGPSARRRSRFAVERGPGSRHEEPLVTFPAYNGLDTGQQEGHNSAAIPHNSYAIATIRP